MTTATSERGAAYAAAQRTAKESNAARSAFQAAIEASWRREYRALWQRVFHDLRQLLSAADAPGGAACWQRVTHDALALRRLRESGLDLLVSNIDGDFEDSPAGGQLSAALTHLAVWTISAHEAPEETRPGMTNLARQDVWTAAWSYFQEAW